MVQGRGGLRFALKTSKGLGILRDFVREKLQRNKAAKPGVFRFVDDAHTTATQFFKDAVMGDTLADERLGIRHFKGDRGAANWRTS